MNLALYPGTFDPFTFGHLDILERVVALFDRVEVTVAVNVEKETIFPIEERCDLIRQCIRHLTGVEVVAHEGLIADRARETGAAVLIRGLRQSRDFDYELPMALANRVLQEDLETVFLPASGRHALVSGTLVRDILRWNGDVSAFVPEPVLNALVQRTRP